MQLSESQMTLDNVRWILPINEKYDRLSKFTIYTLAKKFITSVVRKTHIPFFQQEWLWFIKVTIILQTLGNQKLGWPKNMNVSLKWSTHILKRKLDHLSVLTVHTTHWRLTWHAVAANHRPFFRGSEKIIHQPYS